MNCQLLKDLLFIYLKNLQGFLFFSAHLLFTRQNFICKLFHHLVLLPWHELCWKQAQYSGQQTSAIWIPEHSIALQQGKNRISIHCFPNQTHLTSMFKNFSSRFKVLTVIVVFQIPGTHLFLISKIVFLLMLMFFLNCILV